MPGNSLTVEQIMDMLAAAPPRIAEMTGGLSEEQLHAAPSPGEWCADEVLAHLRSCADVWGDCIAAIIRQDMPPIRAVDPRTWIKSTDYLELDFRPSLQTYSDQRTFLLALLGALEPGTWSLSVTVTSAGWPIERNLFSFAQRMAKHERPHLKQITQLVSDVR